MADFDFGEFLRTKRIQDAVNAHDPSYNPDDATHWLSAAHNIASPGSQSSLDTQSSIQFPQFTPDATQSIGPVQPQENNAQPKSESQISPMGPEESKYREMLGQTPLRSQDKSGMLRKVLGGVAGIGSGIHTSDPRVGSEVTESVTHAPYYQKLQGFNQGLAIQQIKSQAETGDVASAAKNQELVARRNAEEARAEAENARKQDFVYRSSEQAHQRKLEELAVQHPGSNAFHEAKLKDGTLVYLKRDSQTGKLINTDTNLPVEMSAVDVLSDPNKSLRQTQEEKTPAALQAGIAARRILANPNKQGTPDAQAATDFLDALQRKGDPKAAFDYIVTTRNEERKAQGRKPMSSDEAEALQIKLLGVVKPVQPPIMVDENRNVFRPQINKPLPPNSRTLPNESSMNTPTSATRGRGEAAQTAIAAGKDVQEFADKNRDKLGNIGTYWSNLVQGTPAADPIVEKFRGKVASWAAFQAAAHGFRASSIMKEFEQRVGAAKNVDSIISAIQGINDELQHAVDTGQGKQGQESNTLPGGISIQDIDAEIARRKGKK